MSKINVLYIYFYLNSDIKLDNRFSVKRIYAFKNNFKNINFDNYDLIILGGGKSNINPMANHLLEYIPLLKNVLKLKNKKILGICYGMQILCSFYNGKITALKERHKTRKHIKIKNFPLLNARFNHKYKCNTNKKVLNYVKKGNEKIPNFIKFSKNHYGIQSHFTNSNERSFFIKKIFNNEF